MTAPRKGSSRVADVPADVLAQLNAGTLETATLAEGLAIDFAALAAAALPDLDLAPVRAAAGKGVTLRMPAVAAAVLARPDAAAVTARWTAHPSDTVRGWACYLIGLAPTPADLSKRLARLRPLADDRHFGVREWAWMAVRQFAVADVRRFLAVVTPWTAEACPNLRRFAVEATRPRGVWAAHIDELKRDPGLALPLLEPLRADPAGYVQDSVANWLNDAAKSRPEWVRELCGRWRRESPGPATERICKRATRSLK